MEFEAVLLGGLLYAGLGCSLFFCYYSVRNRDKRGAKSLAVLFVGISVWVLSDIIQLHTPATATPPVGVDARLLGPDIAVVGVFLFGLEYTGRESLIDRWVVSALALKPGLSLGLLFSPLRPELFVEDAGSVGIGYTFGNTVVQVAHTLYSWSLAFLGLALLAQTALGSNDGHRRPVVAMIAAVSFPLGVNVLFHAGVLRRDVTSVSFVVTAVVVTYAAFRLRLMDTIPLARQTVLEEMEDMVVVLDEQDQVVSVNDAVRERFGDDQTFEGATVTALLGTPVENGDGEDIFAVETTIDGDDRHLEINSSPVTDSSDEALGRVLVCRDVTEREQRAAQLRQRESELELLKDLQSRFLRHNLRNELNVIRLNAALLHDEDDPEERERYELIVDKTDQMLDWGTKARTIEQLVETDEQTAHNLAAVVEPIVEETRREFPAATVESTVDDDLWVEAIPQVHPAVENVLDNAVRHNTAEEPRVTVDAEQTGETVVVSVGDNGPGVDALEVETIQKESEGSIVHASGLGLWLVYWVLDKSGGDVAFETDDGTVVHLEFPAAEPP